MNSVLVIKNWERFQHYKDRNAPWVKLYRDLLTSESWVLGNDLARVLQLASMAIAPRYDNKIPYRFDLLKKVMSLDCTEGNFAKAIAHLVETNFLEIQRCTDEQKPVEQNASTLIATCTSEENRGEENRKDMSASPTPAIGIQKVFDHWRQTHNHPRSRLDDKRYKLIALALKSYSADDLCLAISGYKNSPHHMGKNERHTVYDDIELFLRDSKHIDAGMKFADKSGEPQWAT